MTASQAWPRLWREREKRDRAADGQGPRAPAPSQAGTQGPGQMRLDEVPSSLGLSDSILPRSLQKIGLSQGSQDSSSCQVLAGHTFPAASSPQSTYNWPAQSSDHHGCLLTAPAFSALRRVGGAAYPVLK